MVCQHDKSITIAFSAFFSSRSNIREAKKCCYCCQQLRIRMREWNEMLILFTGVTVLLFTAFFSIFSPVNLVAFVLFNHRFLLSNLDMYILYDCTHLYIDQSAVNGAMYNRGKTNNLKIISNLTMSVIQSYKIENEYWNSIYDSYHRHLSLCIEYKVLNIKSHKFLFLYSYQLLTLFMFEWAFIKNINLLCIEQL